MAFGTIVATNLVSGSSVGVSVAGSYTIVVTGTFTKALADGTITPAPAYVYLELSGDDGTTWAPLPESAIKSNQAFDMDIATGAKIRLTVPTGITLGGTGVSARMDLLP